MIKWASASNQGLGQSPFHGAFLEGEYCLEFFLNPNPFGMFSDVQMLGEPLGKKVRGGLVIFENHLGLFIDQIFGASKSDWKF